MRSKNIIAMFRQKSDIKSIDSKILGRDSNPALLDYG